MLNKIFEKHIKNYKAKDLMVKHVITLPPVENLWKAQKHDVKIQDKKNRRDSN